MRIFFFFIVMVWTQSALAEPIKKEEIIDLVKASVTKTQWTHDASFNLKRGVGGELSSWIVSISCNACSSAIGPQEHKVLVITLDRDGNILCAVSSGVHRCGEKIGNGGITSQDMNITDAQGNKVEVEERYQSVGGRSISVEYYICPPSGACKAVQVD
jgi:hypothetical protein